ncbi:TetR/AcrR family transcriptional regulator [Pseudomonas sp. 5P_3.1_Bac2]|uniref:TetR/AcrR family transcriptional regulator n=1 Tax=Pseudomonas sp. 5P_3.1_Bac2 TaxID=2971617 RepID=UPI0021C9150E|nr:TetR/AcrR family transcriptional regulator [Pseudomonas sp. 5P_3.1_Bac2]MCU1717481.1 TetR/AcrR family transcriptional regulator [Pseudomonas sp. 5P_3.1_Bac2]
MPHPTALKRPRGRPGQSHEHLDAMRRQILAATRAVFILRGYHGLSVELIVTQAGISRPTFYKYFTNCDAAIDQLLGELNAELLSGLTQVTDQAQGVADKVEAALDYCRHWGHAQGAMLRPLFAELHDPHSPASKHRQHTLQQLATRLNQLIETLGRARPPGLLVEVLINAVEFLLYRFHLQTPDDDAAWQITRSAMLRLVLGLLGNQQDWAHALPIAQALNIDLNAVELPDAP